MLDAITLVYVDSHDLRKIVPARRSDEDSTNSTARSFNAAGAVLRKSCSDAFLHQTVDLMLIYCIRQGSYHAPRFIEKGFLMSRASGEQGSIYLAHECETLEVAVAVTGGPRLGRLDEALILLTLALGFMMAMVDVTSVNIALPAIASNFSLPLSRLVWVVDAYTLSFASLLLIGGALAERWGAKTTYQAGLLIFIMASLLCGMADSGTLLIIARLLQGPGCGIVHACLIEPHEPYFPGPETAHKNAEHMVGAGWRWPAAVAR